jgi:hypothetical protein
MTFVVGLVVVASIVCVAMVFIAFPTNYGDE